MKLPPFTAMYVQTIDSRAWRALPHGARSLFVYMKRHYNRKQQKAVYLSIRAAAKELGAGRNTVARWLRALTIGGFIVQIQAGFLGPDGSGKAALYRLTDEPFEGRPPARDFLHRNGNGGKQNPGSEMEPPCSEMEPLVAPKRSHPKSKNQQKPGGSKMETHLEEASSHLASGRRGRESVSDVRLTKRGRQALRAPDGLRADHLLYIEILARIGGCAGGKNVDDMTDELIAHFGSAEAALTAVKCGQVRFEKINDEDPTEAA